MLSITEQFEKWIRRLRCLICDVKAIQEILDQNNLTTSTSTTTTSSTTTTTTSP